MGTGGRRWDSPYLLREKLYILQVKHAGIRGKARPAGGAGSLRTDWEGKRYRIERWLKRGDLGGGGKHMGGGGWAEKAEDYVP